MSLIGKTDICSSCYKDTPLGKLILVRLKFRGLGFQGYRDSHSDMDFMCRTCFYQGGKNKYYDNLEENEKKLREARKLLTIEIPQDKPEEPKKIEVKDEQSNIGEVSC